MAGIRLEQFSGIAPKISDLLLPPNMAADARNARLLSGELRSIKSPTLVYDFSNALIQTAIRIPDPGQTPEEIWLGFEADDIDFVEGPFVKNADPAVEDRFYWSGDPNYTYPVVNNRSGLRAASTAYRIGVPAPAGTFSVTPRSIDTWLADTAYVVDDVVVGTATSGVKFVCVTAGTSDSSEPTWNTTSGDQTTDNTVVWEAVGIGDTETRAYVYTYINDWNEEGVPSEPILASGATNDVWDISGLDTSPADTNMVPVNTLRIYRTVTGESSALYYFVTEIDITPGDGTHPGTYADDNTSEEVVQNNVLNSFDWEQPPDQLEGLISHPGGFLVGFVGNELFFSEAYRPWAWPTAYILALENHVVGLAIFNNQLVALTDSKPYFIPGTHPSNLSIAQSEAIEPCLSKRSIVPTISGVLYGSPNGLILFNNGGAAVITNSIISKDEWQSQFSPSTIKATQQGQQYLAFTSPSSGFEFSPNEPLGVLSTFDKFSNVDNIFTDRYDGTVYLLQDGQVTEWDSDVTLPLYYTWKSKEFDFPRPVNLGAIIVKMDIDVDDPPPDPSQELLDWNAERYTRPLNPLGFTALGGPRYEFNPAITDVPISDPDLQAQVVNGDRYMYPVGGSPLFNLSYALDPSVRSAIIKVYADRELKYQAAVRPNVTMRLPSGFKHHYWQIEVLSNVDIYSIAIAETAKELMEL